MMLCGKMWAMILLTVVISVTARPEEKIEPETPRQIQQQPIDRETRSFSSFPREGSDAYWMFHTPTRPVMYIPEYNAVLVPAGSRPQSVKPTQPPKRRRPLADLIKFMQGKTSGIADVSDEEVKSNIDSNVDDINSSMTQKEHEDLLENMRQLVKIGVVDNIQIINQPEEEARSYPHGLSYIYHHHHNAFNNLRSRNFNISPASSSLMSSLSSLIKSEQNILPNNNDNTPGGYHYSYKYTIPSANSPSKSAQVFVQHKSIPDPKPIVNYRSPRPEIQEKIQFNKLPRINTNDEQKSNNNNTKNSTNTVKQQQPRNNQNQQQQIAQEEKKILVKFDNENGGLSEVKVNTKSKPLTDNNNNNSNKKTIFESLNLKNNENIKDIPVVQVETHSRKQTVHIMDGNSMHFIPLMDTKSPSSDVVITTENNTKKPLKISPIIVKDNNSNNNHNARILIKEINTPSEDVHESMIIMRGRKPSELILSPIARAVAGPRGVAIAAPIAKAVLRRGDDVSLQFDPDSVAIAGPGGRAHSHPRFIISYVNDTKPN